MVYFQTNATSVEKRATSGESVLRGVQTNASNAKRRVIWLRNAQNPSLIVVATKAEGEEETEDVAELEVVEEETWPAISARVLIIGLGSAQNQRNLELEDVDVVEIVVGEVVVAMRDR